MAQQTVDPWPRHANNNNLAFNGERMQRAVQCYRADKVTAIRQTRAEVVCAADNSCLMHIGGALSRQRTGVRTMHLAEILASTGGMA